MHMATAQKFPMIVPANVRCIAENSSHTITNPGTSIPWQQTAMTANVIYLFICFLFNMKIVQEYTKQKK